MGRGRRELWPLTKVIDGEGEEGIMAINIGN